MLRRLRHALQLSDRQTLDLFAQAGPPPSSGEVRGWSRKEGEPGWEPCPPARLGQFLDGLVRDRRGPPPPGAPVVLAPVNNNEVLKKLRIAFSLREGDMLAMLEAGGQKMSKGELGGLLRRPDHPNFRECGDQALRKFLTGFTQSMRRGKSDAKPSSRPRPSAPSGAGRRSSAGARPAPQQSPGGGKRVRRPVGRRRLVHDAGDAETD
ncbi:MAG: hypothetical protein ACI8PZ_006602 [Myxococcota bacterium]